MVGLCNIENVGTRRQYAASHSRAQKVCTCKLHKWKLCALLKYKFVSSSTKSKAWDHDLKWPETSFKIFGIVDEV